MLMFEFVQLKPIGSYKNLAVNKTLFCIFLTVMGINKKVQLTNNYINFKHYIKPYIKPWLVSHPKPYIKEG